MRGEVEYAIRTIKRHNATVSNEINSNNIARCGEYRNHGEVIQWDLTTLATFPEDGYGHPSR